MSLFDADDYTKKGATPKRTRAPSRARVRPVAEVRASSVWRLVHRLEPGVVHAERVDTDTTAHRTWCGVYGVPMTFDDGQLVNGCVDCVAAIADSHPAEGSE